MPLTHKGFSAWIMCNGKVLEQFDEGVKANDNEKICYIPSEAGETFSVAWKDNKGTQATSGHVFIDGRDVASAIIRPGRGKPVERSGAKINSRTMKPFSFSDIELTDDDKIASRHDSKIGKIGSISVQISYVKLGPPVPFKPYQATNIGPVHEKGKKAGAHCTSYGEAQNCAPGRAVSTAPLDPSNPGPQVTLTFIYRNKGFLQAKGIIPNPNRKQSPPKEDEIIEILDDESDKQHDSSPTLQGGEESPRPTKKAKTAQRATSENDDFFAATGEEAHAEPATGKDATPISQTQEEQPLFLEDDEVLETQQEGESLKQVGSTGDKGNAEVDESQE